ncbi:WD40 repeat-like protein [Rhizopogon vinicolor AM-OR11-026]|uniref:WD40 repeat-like protein n=1 Tax=Rhizopogon vinicolor AM-OR11-026 TaxID=1314800 RepID=A0A1B7MQN0_9AGAM|nr:WD40 repeat-like protein [Rhizopogon vinicolor AM-OR11-026]
MTSVDAARNARQKGPKPSRILRGHTDCVWSVAFFHHGRWVITGSGDGTLKIWEVQDGTCIGEPFEGHEGIVASISISPDDRRIVTGGQDERIIIWDVGSRQKVLEPPVKHTDWANAVCLSPDGKRFASAGDKRVIVWDAETGTELATFAGHRKEVLTVAFSPDGLKLSSGSADHTIRVWHANNAELLLEINAHQDWVKMVVWSPDGQQLVSSSADLTVKFWDACNGDQIGQPCTGHTSRIDSVALAPDASFIATASLDGTARLWSTKTRQQIGPSFPHAYGAYCVAISPDGKLLVCGDMDRYASIWSIEGTLELHEEQENEKEELEAEQRQYLARASHSQVPPEAILQDLTAYITKVEDHPVARGGFGEIWKCIYETDGRHIDVAVKALVVYVSDEAMEKKSRRIRRELRTCAKLKHQNILPVYGYTYNFGLLMAIVSPWADYGNLTTYIDNEDAMLDAVRRFQLLTDITAGLKYLHANNVIHGDLNGPNVLIHGDGTACLADFGLSLVYSEVISASVASWTSSFHGNFRWLAPELIGEPEDELPVRPNESSDIYSFGGIMLQVLTSKIPYYYLGEVAVSRCIYTGVKPSRSRYPAISDKYWDFIEECWSSLPQDRPSTERVVEVIMDEFDSLSIAIAGS